MARSIRTIALALFALAVSGAEYRVADFQQDYRTTVEGGSRATIAIPPPVWSSESPNVDGWDYVVYDTTGAIASLGYHGPSAGGCITGYTNMDPACLHVSQQSVRPGFSTNRAAAKYAFQQYFPSVKINGTFTRIYPAGSGDGVGVEVVYHTLSGAGIVFTPATLFQQTMLPGSGPVSFSLTLASVREGEVVSFRVASNNNADRDNVTLDVSVVSDCSIPCDCIHCLQSERDLCHTSAPYTMAPKTKAPVTKAPPTRAPFTLAPDYNTEVCEEEPCDPTTPPGPEYCCPEAFTMCGNIAAWCSRLDTNCTALGSSCTGEPNVCGVANSCGTVHAACLQLGSSCLAQLSTCP